MNFTFTGEQTLDQVICTWAGTASITSIPCASTLAGTLWHLFRIWVALLTWILIERVLKTFGHSQFPAHRYQLNVRGPLEGGRGRSLSFDLVLAFQDALSWDPALPSGDVFMV